MYTPIYMTLNQQFNAGQQYGNQGGFAEMQGNYPFAANCYDQAIAWIGASMQTARQAMIPVPDNVLHSFGLAHFYAARAKTALGAAPMTAQMTAMHLNEALTAFNMAASANPTVYQHHLMRGVVLMTLGNLAEAEGAFNAALRLYPNEPWSQYMLAMLNNARGNFAVANSYYSAAQAMAPQLPQPQIMPQPGSGNAQSLGGEGPANWSKTVIDTCKVLQNVFQTVNSFNSMMGSWPQ